MYRFFEFNTLSMRQFTSFFIIQKYKNDFRLQI